MPISRDNIGRLDPCNHEEVDNRMLFHAADAVQCGFTKILLYSVDTYVLFLAVAFVEKWQEFQGDQIQKTWQYKFASFGQTIAAVYWFMDV